MVKRKGINRQTMVDKKTTQTTKDGHHEPH